MDTIVAISTARGVGGIGIIRMSGKDCFKILDKIFIPKSKEEIKGYKIKYGNIVEDNGKIIDEVLVSYFVGPKSYTKENMCEINSHGGVAVEKRILEECIKNGARIAEPGEFTKRAFINGRIDLTQAEAVIDLINSKTETERKASISQLEGVLSNRIKRIQNRIMELMINIEVSIDYPEYELEEKNNEEIMKEMNNIIQDLERLSRSYNNAKTMKDGIKTAIIGKPNVGKSSLLNLLLNEERAIVSDIEGTTRDTIEECVEIEGIKLKIIDTAGIRNSSDEIEKIGVKKSINITSSAELIFAIFDDSRALEEEDIKILELIKNKTAIIIINKTDLKKNLIDLNKIKKYNKNIVMFSTKDERGLLELYKKVKEIYEKQGIEENNEEMITNLRQKQHIDKSIEIAEKIKKTIEKGETMDIISIQIKQILEELGSITGTNVSEDIINEIFSKFCLGK